MLELRKQYTYYLEHETELLEKYEGKYLVISEDCEVAPFENKQDAYYYGVENFGLGHFLLQYCNYESVHTVNTVNYRIIA